MPTTPDNLEIVQLMKQEWSSLGGDANDEVDWGADPIDPTEDLIEVAGVAVIDAGDTRPNKDRAIWADGDDLRFRDLTITGTSGEGVALSTLVQLWQLVSNYLEPVTDGNGIRLYHTDGTQYVTLRRTSGNFAISIGGTDAQALYKNCKIERTQLGGQSSSELSEVSNGVDAPCHTIYGDRTTKLYGYQRHTDAGSSTNYMDVGRDASQGYLVVNGGDRIFQATQKIFEVRLAGSTTDEMLRVISDAGDVFKAYANQNCRFYGNILADTNNANDIGSNTMRWRSGYFQTEVRLTSGGIGYTLYKNGSIQNLNAPMTIDGGQGLTFQLNNAISISTYKFVGNSGTNQSRARVFYGTGTGATHVTLTHDGSDASVVSGSGDLKLGTDGACVELNTQSADPSSPTDGGVWHNSTDDKFRGRLNSVTRDFSMEFPPGTGDPSSGMVDGDRYYNTTLKTWMTYDASRSKWMSMDSVTIQTGRQGDTLATAYYRGVNGLTLSSTIGYPALWDGTIVGLSYTRSDTDAATFEVVAGGTAIAELASSAGSGYSTALDGDFSQGDILAVRNKTGSGTTSNVQIWITIRWRAGVTRSLLSEKPKPVKPFI